MKTLMTQLFLFLLFLLLTHSTIIATSSNLTVTDLEAAIFALRSSGYNLFANSIAVSDLSTLLLSSSTTTNATAFTLLAPPNTALFSLDMSTDAFSYVHSLRFHVVPARLSFSHLRNVSLSPFPHLPTLNPNHLLSLSSSSFGDLVSVDGVRVSFPDMYLTDAIAVHGLDGILASSTVDHELGYFSAAPQPFAGAFSPSETVPVPAPNNEDFAGTLPPVIGGSIFNSVSLPPEKNGGAPSTSPPSKACSNLNDCETEFVSPYIWPPVASTIPSPPSPPPATATISLPLPPPALESVPSPRKAETVTVISPPMESGGQWEEKDSKKRPRHHPHHHRHGHGHSHGHHHHHARGNDEKRVGEAKEKSQDYVNVGQWYGNIGRRIQESDEMSNNYEHVNFAKYNRNVQPAPLWW